MQRGHVTTQPGRLGCSKAVAAFRARPASFFLALESGSQPSGSDRPAHRGSLSPRIYLRLKPHSALTTKLRLSGYSEEAPFVGTSARPAAGRWVRARCSHEGYRSSSDARPDGRGGMPAGCPEEASTSGQLQHARSPLPDSNLTDPASSQISPQQPLFLPYQGPSIRGAMSGT